jgi:SAM-dependent methyltransferase
MATPWDRAAPGYLETWVPRFTPYHVDLVRELALNVGQRVLVVSAGPGAEALAAVRAVDLEGYVRVTDKSEEMIRLCRDRMDVAGFGNARSVRCEVADASDASGGPWDSVICAFGLWQLDGDPVHGATSPRQIALRAWGEALGPSGKVGVLIWGPSEPDDPFERLFEALRGCEPKLAPPRARVLAERDAMAALFESAGLAVVRHTVIRHPVVFPTAEAFVRAVRESCVWRRVWEEIGDVRMHKVALAYYEKNGGPDAPVSFEPMATMVIGARPGAQVDLDQRPSVRVPKH